MSNCPKNCSSKCYMRIDRQTNRRGEAKGPFADFANTQKKWNNAIVCIYLDFIVLRDKIMNHFSLNPFAFPFFVCYFNPSLFLLLSYLFFLSLLIFNPILLFLWDHLAFCVSVCLHICLRLSIRLFVPTNLYYKASDVTLLCVPPPDYFCWAAICVSASPISFFAVRIVSRKLMWSPYFLSGSVSPLTSRFLYGPCVSRRFLIPPYFLCI
jgi:hypothetical protein